MRTLAQRRSAVQHMARVVNYFGTAPGVVAAFFANFLAAGCLGDQVSAVQGVVQAAPARVGGIERIAGIEHRHHQLRPGLLGEFGVHLGGADLDLARLRHQVADALQKSAVGRHVLDRAGMGAVPLVKCRLQPITLGQQGDVFGRQIGDDGIKALPEARRADAGAG